MKNYEELLKNYEVREGTFIYSLNYKYVFDVPEFNKLIREVVSYLLDHKMDNEDKLIFLKYFFWFYSRLSNLLFSHLNKKDLYKIKNWNLKYLFLMNRIEVIIEYVLDDKIKILNDYIDEFGTFKNCTFPQEIELFKK
jgi:hypothetical protein